MKVNPDYVRKVMALSNAAPYTQLVSMRLVEMDIGHAAVELDLEPKHLQEFGIVDGGMISTLIDTAAFWSGFMSIEDESAGLTSVDLKLNFLGAATEGKLRATGRQIKSGRTLNYAEAHIEREDGRIIAHGTSTMMVLPGHALVGSEDMPPKFLRE